MTDHRAIGRREALAYRVWAVAAPAGWNMTCTEIADAIEAPFHAVRRIVQDKRWNDRLPTRTLSYRNDNTLAPGLMYHGFDGPASLQKGDGVGGV